MGRRYAKTMGNRYFLLKQFDHKYSFNSGSYGDDEFDAKFATFESRNWSKFDLHNDITSGSINDFKGVLATDVTAGTHGTTFNLIGFYKSIPTEISGNFQVAAKFFSLSATSNLFQGIFVSENLDSDPSGSNFYLVEIDGGGNRYRGVVRPDFSNASATSIDYANIESRSNTWKDHYARLRITGSLVKFDYSRNGYTWHNISSRTISSSISKMGFFISFNGGANENKMFIEWFRVYPNSDLNYIIGK